MQRSIFLLLFFVNMAFTQIIVDHTAVDLFPSIPPEIIQKLKKKYKIHYQHTSHGSQVITGLERIETELYDIAYAEESLPNEEGALNIYDDRFPVESDYWDAPFIIPALENYPEINISIWSWCTELNRKPEEQMWRYYDGMDSIAQHYPDVLFIYMTCNAQSWDGHHTYSSSSEGYNRYLRNEEIRQHCRDNTKVLYDFGDIDAWYDGERATSEYNGFMFPHEHPHYNYLDIHHTSYENCENKGTAFWYLLALLTGWDISLAVNLVSFEAVSADRLVTLKWITESEVENLGYIVKRSNEEHGKFETISSYLDNHDLEGAGNSAHKNMYAYDDYNVANGGTYWYKLIDVNYAGKHTEHQPVVAQPKTAERRINLAQNYPNPFNSYTKINFNLSNDSYVNLKVYDTVGQEIETLISEPLSSGSYDVSFRPLNIPSGVYFYSLQVGDQLANSGKFQDVKKMIILR